MAAVQAAKYLNYNQVYSRMYCAVSSIGASHDERAPLKFAEKWSVRNKGSSGLWWLNMWPHDVFNIYHTALIARVIKKTIHIIHIVCFLPGSAVKELMLPGWHSVQGLGSRDSLQHQAWTNGTWKKYSLWGCSGDDEWCFAGKVIY